MRASCSSDGTSTSVPSGTQPQRRTHADVVGSARQPLLYDREQPRGECFPPHWDRGDLPLAFIPSLVSYASGATERPSAPLFPRPPCPPPPIAEDAMNDADWVRSHAGPTAPMPSTTPLSTSTASGTDERDVNRLAVPPWGGLRGGHQLPPGAYKSAVAACHHRHNDRDCNGEHDVNEVSASALLRLSPRQGGTAVPAPSAATRGQRPGARAHDSTEGRCRSQEHLDVRRSGDGLTTQGPPHDQTQEANDSTSERDTIPSLEDNSTVVLELPVPPLRPSPHQLRQAGPGGFTTLFVKHIPPALTTGMHVQPFLPSEGLVRISVKCICGKNAAFAQYETPEAAFHALVWLYQTSFRRVVSAAASAQSTVLPTRGQGMTSTAPGEGASAVHDRNRSRRMDPTDDDDDATHKTAGVCGTVSYLSSSVQPAAITTSTALRGAALCEAMARATAGMAVALRSRYSLPLPHAVARQLAGSDDARLACVQAMVPVLIAEWSSGLEAGRAKAWELVEQPQDYGRAMSPLCFDVTQAPYRSDETLGRLGDYGGAEQGVAARTVFVRARRDYRLFYCDGQGCCRRLQAARSLSTPQPAEVSIPATSTPTTTATANTSPTAAVTPPSQLGEATMCTCLLHEASVADRCEFVFIARIMRPHFFSTTFGGVLKFRSFLEPPFRGGCFVSFDTIRAARECVEWFWQQPYLVALFDVQLAKRDTLQP